MTNRCSFPVTGTGNPKRRLVTIQPEEAIEGQRRIGSTRAGLGGRG